MGNLKPLTLALLSLQLISCGSGLPVSLDEKRVVTGEQRQARLAGVVDLGEGRTLDLGEERTPIVLMFTTYTCRSCREEAKKLAGFFQDKPSAPKNTRFVTVMVGGSLETVGRWKARICEMAGFENCVKWEAGVMANEDLFLERCQPERVTPCVLTQNLRTQPPVVKRVGEVPLAKLEQETGPWEY